MVVLKLLSLLAAALLSFFVIKMLMMREMQPVRVKANRQQRHPQQVRREQGGFVPACPRPDFQHGRARIRRIARQHGNREAVFGLGQFRFQPGDFLFRQFPHLGIVELGQAGQLAAHGDDIGRDPSHGLKLGKVTAGRDEVLAFQRTRSQPRLQFGKARCNLGKAGVRDAHASSDSSRADTRTASCE